MGEPRFPEKAKLITGLISAEEKYFGEAEKLLSADFGEVDYRSIVLPFDFTDHYAEEMGEGLKRKFLSFKNLVDIEKLAGIKLAANAMEKQLCGAGGRRKVNIDPGLLSHGKLLLASTKDHAHRIYIGKGIYAEVTLHFRGREFVPWEHTYPDYGTPEYRKIFGEIRKLLGRRGGPSPRGGAVRVP